MTVQYDYSNKVVAITGAASGFGKLAAENFANAGAKLFLSDVNIEALKQLVLSLQASGADVYAVQCDIADENQVHSMFEQIIEKFGKLDVAINNAGVIQEMKRLGDCTEAMFDFNIGINLKGTFLCMKSTLNIMAEQGSGCILNIASASGLIGSPFLGLYSAAKHGVIGLTKSAAIEYARKGVRINALCPAFSSTKMLDQVVADKGNTLVQGITENIPAQRLAEPQEVVDAMLWLCSAKNSYMNGAAVSIDGGLVAS